MVMTYIQETNMIVSSKCRSTELSQSRLIWSVEFHKGHAWARFQILKHNLPSVHTYADNTQLYLSFKPSDSSSEVEAVSGMQKCICDVRPWMREDQLMLSDDKTEFLIIGTRQQFSKVSIQSIKIGQTEVSPVGNAR